MRYPFHRDSEPSQIQDPGPLAQYQRAWAAQGNMPALAEPRVQLGIGLDDLTLPEYWWLRRAHRVMSQCQLAAVAANFGAYTLSAKPSNVAQVIICIERMIFMNNTAAAVQVRWGVGPANGAVGTFFDLQFMDDRQAATPFTFFQAGQDNTSAVSIFPGAPNTYMSTAIGAGASVVIEPNIILIGNQSLNLQTAVINQGMNFHLFGRERILNPSER